MKILIWNIRGMGNPARVRQLKEIVKEQRCEIVGVQETIKQAFSDIELRALTPGQDFRWKWLPAQGHSGGILVGVKDDVLQVEDWVTGSHFVGVQVRNRLSNFRCKLLVVYGPADHSLSRGFFTGNENGVRSGTTTHGSCW